MKRQGKHKIIFIYLILIEHSNLTIILRMQNCLPVCIKAIYVNLPTIIDFFLKYLYISVNSSKESFLTSIGEGVNNFGMSMVTFFCMHAHGFRVTISSCEINMQ